MRNQPTAVQYCTHASKDTSSAPPHATPSKQTCRCAEAHKAQQINKLPSWLACPVCAAFVRSNTRGS